MNQNLSYVNLNDNTAKVTCPCGWESAPFRRGPFDPAEALVAFQVEHLKCQDPPVVYYAVAQVIHGKVKILSELSAEPGYREKMEETAKALAPAGRTMEVVEIKVISSWKGPDV